MAIKTMREKLYGELCASLKNISGVKFYRGNVAPQKIGDIPIIAFFDGEVQEMEVALSPLRYHYRLLAELNCQVAHGDDEARIQNLDALLLKISPHLLDWQVGDIAFEDDYQDGVAVRTAILTITTNYWATSPIS